MVYHIAVAERRTESLLWTLILTVVFDGEPVIKQTERNAPVYRKVNVRIYLDGSAIIESVTYVDALSVRSGICVIPYVC